jgi:membrane protein
MKDENKSMNKGAAISRASDFWKQGMWTVRLKDLTPARAFLLRYLRVIVIAIRGFVKDDCQKAASVLTYYSLLNIVPLFAMAFAIAKGFGLEKLVREQILRMAEKANWQSGVTDQLLSFSSALLEQTKGGLIAGMGVIMLFWTVISIMGRIEETFNSIWSVPKPRTLARKFSDYIAIIALAPVLFAISNSVTVVAASKIGVIIRQYAPSGGIVTLVFFLLELLPYLSIWALLTVLYLTMPNTKVPFHSCLVGGIAAGTVFQIVQWAYIKFQIGVTSYGAIYGSFAALPLFLVWLQMSWMIILFGAEMAHADEHYETFGLEPDYTGISAASRKLLALGTLHLLVRRFAEGANPPDIKEIANALEVPLLLIREVLADLTAAGLAVQVVGRAGALSFQPARSLEKITVKDVLDACEKKGKALSLRSSPPEVEQISAYLREISDAMEKSEGNVRLRDI